MGLLGSDHSVAQRHELYFYGKWESVILRNDILLEASCQGLSGVYGHVCGGTSFWTTDIVLKALAGHLQAPRSIAVASLFTLGRQKLFLAAFSRLAPGCEQGRDGSASPSLEGRRFSCLGFWAAVKLRLALVRYSQAKTSSPSDVHRI